MPIGLFVRLDYSDEAQTRSIFLTGYATNIMPRLQWHRKKLGGNHMATIWRSFHPQSDMQTVAQSHHRRNEPNNAPAYKAYQMHWVRSSPDEEKRQCNRRGLRCKMTLIDNAPAEDIQVHPIPAECMNISDNGLYGIVPIGYGVAMGQRYTFQLEIAERGPESGADEQVVSQQGTIVRAELLINPDGEGNRVGIGVKLLGRRTGIVPMPDHP